MMLSFKNFWRRSFGSGDVYRPPEKDEHMVACDTLMSELDFHIKELDRSRQEQEQEKRRMKTGISICECNILQIEIGSTSSGASVTYMAVIFHPAVSNSIISSCADTLPCNFKRLSKIFSHCFPPSLYRSFQLSCVPVYVFS